LVEVVLGPKWIEAAPVVHWLALAMPMMTLQTLYAPASDACGRPGIGAKNGATGAILLSAAFLVGVHWGLMGLVAAWFAAYPLYLAISTWRTLPVIGVRLRDLADGLAPPVIAATGMAVIVSLLARILPPMPALAELALLGAAGVAAYGGWLALFARDTLDEVVALVRNRRG
jgi:O-antigen/teichoic acid export membrane protein